MPKEKIINIRVEGDLKKKAKKLAENDGRSLYPAYVFRLTGLAGKVPGSSSTAI